MMFSIDVHLKYFYFREKMRTTDQCERKIKESSFEQLENLSQMDKILRVHKSLMPVSDQNNDILDQQFSTNMLVSQNTPQKERSVDDRSSPVVMAPLGTNPNENLRTSFSDLSTTTNIEQDCILDFSTYQNKVFTPSINPPSRTEVLEKMQKIVLPVDVQEVPFYSDPRDVAKSLEIGNTVLTLKSKSAVHLNEFKGTLMCLLNKKTQSKPIDLPSKSDSFRKSETMTPVYNPPNFQSAKQWLATKLSVRNNCIATPTSPKVLKDEKKCVAVVRPNTNLSTTTYNTSVVVSPLMSSTPIHKVMLSQTKRFARISSNVHKILPSISQAESLEVNQLDYEPSVQVPIISEIFLKSLILA